MTDNALTSTTPGEPAARGSDRSPALAEVRGNLFRVLRLPVSAGADEAIWKAEELLTLLRAGVPPQETDPAPWLAPPTEAEVRSAVQAAEEPLRRLLARLCWFDFDADPDGERLRQAVATLDPTDVRAALDTPATGEDPPAGAAASSRDYHNTVRELNRANLLLLLATRAINTASGHAAATKGTGRKWSWTQRDGVRVAANPHAVGAGDDGQAADVGRAADLWSQALSRWSDLLARPHFQDFLRVCLTELNDDIVGPDDAEGVTNSLWTRLTDLLAGEVKVQLGEGRTDRAAALLRVANTSGIEARRWVLALRSLRPRFKAEVSELLPLASGEVARLDDLELYLGRLRTLAERWNKLDPGGLLSLGEITDEAVAKAVGQLSTCQEYPTVPRVCELLRAAVGAASAESLKSKAVSATKEMDDLGKYACHFCKKRDLELKCSVILSGKKETGRTTYGNTTTVYYSLKKGVVPRCERCAGFHHFLLWLGRWTWITLLPVGLLLAWTFLVGVPRSVPQTGYSSSSYSSSKYSSDSGRGFHPLVIGAMIAGPYLLSGWLVRRITAAFVTPRGERHYPDVSGSDQYKGMNKEGYTITVDYSKNAYGKVIGTGR